MDQHHPSGSVEVNMEVSITADEVIRAGGFGATDDIGSMLPSATDSTDLEDHLLDVRGYEESKDKMTEERYDSPNVNSGAAKSDIKIIDKVEDGFEAVDMEASLFSDDVIRAGGFGATDNIGSFLPVASDYTDFEENLRDARDYEESEQKCSRPGLGWKSE